MNNSDFSDYLYLNVNVSTETIEIELEKVVNYIRQQEQASPQLTLSIDLTEIDDFSAYDTSDGLIEIQPPFQIGDYKIEAELYDGNQTEIWSMVIVIDDTPISSNGNGTSSVNETAELDLDAAVTEFQQWLQDQSFDPD